MTKTQILKDLKARGFSPSQIKQLYKVRDAKYTLSKTGFEVPSVEFIYRDIKGKVIPGASRFKLYWTDEDRKKFKNGKPPKYVSIKGEEPHLYYSSLLPKGLGTWQDVGDDPEVPVLITEGEFKADTANEFGFVTIGIAGVWSWKSKKKKLPVIPDMKQIDWSERYVYLTFDADLKSNSKVRDALNQLSTWLTLQGARVHIVFLPEIEEYPNTGLDDFLVSQGPDDLEELVETAEAFSYCEELLKLNTEVAFVEDPGLVIKLANGFLMKPHQFANANYANRFYWVDTAKGMVKKPAAPAWLKSENRFSLIEMTYRPGDDQITSDRRYNTWKGWGVQPKRGSIAPWRKLLDHVFEKNHEERKWFEQWCAYPLQHPGAKLHCAAAIISPQQGNGKTLIGQTLGLIHGENYNEIGEMELESSFNSWLREKTLICGDEITGSDKKSHHNKIKKLISQTHARINTKGIPEYTLPDCANYYFTSNSSNAFYLENEDRRFFIWTFYGSLPYKFFSDEYVPWMNDGGAAALYDHLLKLDLTGFNPSAPAPITEAKQEMVLDSKGDQAGWVAQLKLDPEEVLHLDNKTLPSDLYTAQQLKVLADPNDRVTMTSFGRMLKDAGFRMKSVKIHGKTFRLYVIRNSEKWEKCFKTKNFKPMAEHYMKFHPNLDGKAKKY